MIGYTTTDTAGNKLFVTTGCQYCQMDTAGNHAYNCPNRGLFTGWEYTNDKETIKPVKKEPKGPIEVVEMDAEKIYFNTEGIE